MILTLNLNFHLKKELQIMSEAAYNPFPSSSSLAKGRQKFADTSKVTFYKNGQLFLVFHRRMYEFWLFKVLIKTANSGPFKCLGLG